MIVPVVLLLVFHSSILCQAQLAARQGCNECNPKGALSETLPEVGPLLANLFKDLVDTVDASGDMFSPISGPAKRQDRRLAFCCASGMGCLLLRDYAVPFCWDRFTTNFHFPDGSYGSLAVGNFTSAAGTVVDLIYGDYKNEDGSTGNLYSGLSSSRPNTSTMSMPAPYTSSGVGSAIPASQLGSMATITDNASDTALPEGTITAITLPSLTISAGPTACGLCAGNHTIFPGPSIGGTWAPAATTGINATSTANTTSSTSGASIIIPPIANCWSGSFGALAQGFLLMLTMWIIIVVSM